MLPIDPSHSRQTLVFDDNHNAVELYGEGDRTLRALERELGIVAHARGNEVRLIGASDRVAAARQVLEELYGWVRSGASVGPRDVVAATRMAARHPGLDLAEACEDILEAVGTRRRVRAKNLSQRRYIELIRDRDLVFATGPAGTGKTYLAMAAAVAALNRRDVDRLVLARPAVEAGERLGFLPGTMAEKVHPYLRPLYDALRDMMPFERAEKLMERGVIEVAPLAFMRGRTLNEAFVILDEAQNTTPEQMKMFLTRLGYDCRAVVTGDITQIDLPRDRESGLVQALRILAGVEGIGFMRFGAEDVVRHQLVQRIIRAYAGGDEVEPEAQPEGEARPGPEAEEPGPPT